MDELSASPGVLPSGISLSGFLIKLSWTERVRAGDIGLIRLKFEGKGLDQEYHWVVETRLELAGVRSSPGEDFQSPLMEGQPVAFFWNLDSIKTGSYPGKVWVYLRPISARPGQASVPVRRAIAAVPLEINFSSIFGLDGSAARTLGAVGIVGGLILFLPPVLPTGKKTY